ncbi:MFS transporter [Gordonia sp. TBRC 11910]|uniref:MFS transporter n=1 Tax=Gordonia asplenii TaxID=2725283 RepID=A0A848L832_9ACTN|nr:MFS transporter [Gordonia asplenii]NMO04913.1 MFS transporter [Gordonia asplenii]
MAISSGARRWIGLIAVALGVALIVMDTTIVNVITPSVIDDLGIDATQAQWIQEGYTIVFAALLLVAGRISDLWGAKRLFLTGSVFFGATSVLAGLAWNGETLVAARFLLGVGAAAILPTSLALLNHMFTGKARGMAFAVWGTTIGAATAVGPVLGGWLSEESTWRWAFGLNVPLVIVILAVGVTFLTESTRSTGGVDVISAILSVLGLGLAAFGLVEGRTYGWIMSKEPFDVFGATWDSGLSPAFVALVLSVLLMGVFVRRQIIISRGGGKHDPLMDMKLFSITSFRNGNFATVIIGLGEYGIIAVLPLWLQFTLGFTALDAGATLVVIAVGSFAASIISFPLADSGKATALDLVRGGLVLEVLGLAGLGVVAWATDANWWFIAAALFVYGVGVGLATAQVTNVVLEEIPESEGGQGSAIQSTFRQLGSALGIAILMTVFFSTLSTTLHDKLVDMGLAPADATRFSDGVTDSAGAAIHSLTQNPATAQIGDAAQSAMSQALAFGSFLGAGFLVLGLLATLFIPNNTMSDDVASDDERDRTPSPTKQ